MHCTGQTWWLVQWVPPCTVYQFEQTLMASLNLCVERDYIFYNLLNSFIFITFFYHVVAGGLTFREGMYIVEEVANTGK